VQYPQSSGATTEFDQITRTRAASSIHSNPLAYTKAHERTAPFFAEPLVEQPFRVPQIDRFARFPTRFYSHSSPTGLGFFCERTFNSHYLRSRYQALIPNIEAWARLIIPRLAVGTPQEDEKTVSLDVNY
jgi:hypothetical protein